MGIKSNHANEEKSPIPPIHTWRNHRDAQANASARRRLGRGLPKVLDSAEEKGEK